LLEEGCAEFSNIRGLTTLRFPKGNLAPAYEEIRRVLNRESARRTRYNCALDPNLITDDEERELREQQQVAEEIPYMTDEEREIIAYLLAHNRKMFTNTPDCGHANTLVSKGIVVLALRPGQRATHFEVPFAIPCPFGKSA
jgi:hypothetical protein